jgi:ferredoxin
MIPVTITIDGRTISVPSGRTILEAARELNISIPTLCHLEGADRFTSCMICVVLEAASNRLLPSCSAPAAEGMQIETDGPRVREARKDALDFLLSEHLGDCEAPCRRACPAHMDIPLMIRQIEDRRFEAAIRTVKKDIALPAVLGRICPAPCENGCHRRSHDAALSICALKRFVADVDLDRLLPFRPEAGPASGKRVAIVGAGPAGLSAAYYLLLGGHACHVYDRNPRPGGMLRYGVPDSALPKSVLDAEIERIAAMGAEFLSGRMLGGDLRWEDLRTAYDAVVLTVGTIDPAAFENAGLVLSRRGLAIDRETFQTNLPGVFAGGNAVSESRLAIRAAAHGKDLAFSVDRYLKTGTAGGPGAAFHSILGKLGDGEAGEFMKEADGRGRTIPSGGPGKGFKEEEAVLESGRCFGCDCRKATSCRLREYSESYRASRRRFTFAERKRFQRNIQHELVVYEPGKCLKCGACVRITKKAGERLGLTFVGRGFDVRVEPPFGEPLSEGLMHSARACVEACPTGALSRRDRRENGDDHV